MDFVKRIFATPSKNIYSAVVADYNNLQLTLCELIDNAIDCWSNNGKLVDLLIEIDFDEQQKVLQIKDNAGGVKEAELRVLISPGVSNSSPDSEVIGIFGVGSKRAVVALSQDIKIRSRFGNEPTYLVRYDQDWIAKEDDWEVSVFKVDNIDAASTIIELQKLRLDLHKKDFADFRRHAGYVYGKMILAGHVRIKLNGTQVNPKNYEEWSYPPDYTPTDYTGKITLPDGIVSYSIFCGLTKSIKQQESEEYDEYGVYFYCNDRLIERAVKTSDVGFGKGQAGKPHTSHQIMRVIVSLKGAAKHMPWNSSKSRINTNHPVFKELQSKIVEAVVHYCKVSKACSGDRENLVFKYKEGTAQKIELPEKKILKNYLPQVSRSRTVRPEEIIRDRNRVLMEDAPWTIGLYEAIVAVDAIRKMHLSNKNRIILILLDSTVEISCKEYLLNRSSRPIGEGTLKTISRTQLEGEVASLVGTSSGIDWIKIAYYYRQRNALIHQRATVQISDEQVTDFRSLVIKLLEVLFGLNFTV